MKAIAATILMAALLAGCGQSTAPAGGNQSAGGAPPAATPATPTLDRAFLVGRWTDTGDCSNSTEFSDNGEFRTSAGASGQWSLAGDRLTLSGAQTFTAQVVVVDQRTISIVNPDGSTGRSTRC